MRGGGYQTPNFLYLCTPQHALLEIFEEVNRPVQLGHNDTLLKKFQKNTNIGKIYLDNYV